ncbi:MAG: pyridoxal-phosphate dependent enzyme [Candidatus Kapabacteria bacterium]|nr:pyridoxal-phosphate dependent enzyme [Candidatus Kapabacteria bacterium]
MQVPNFNNVLEAKIRIEPLIHHTTVHTSNIINEITGCSLFFKCENFQRAGAFKFRGASNAVFALSSEEAERGVATHSSGNHAQALALAAKLRGIPSYVVMPNNSKKVKIDAVQSYGAKIIFCEPTLASREETLEKVVEETNAVFIHPYNNPFVISGQGTAALELINQIEQLDYIITPVGGGGLLSGTLLTINTLSKNTKVIGAEPEGADDAKKSLQTGAIVPSINPKTIADGLLTSLGTITFEIIKNYVYDIITVSDEAIIKAMRLIWERMKIIVEPSSAITLGLLLEKKIDLKNQRIGLILSGGNVDLDHLPW